MEEVLVQSQITAMDEAGDVILDIDRLTQSSDKCCSGNPKITRALSRKGSCRLDRRSSEEQEFEEASKKLVNKVIPLQMEQLKQPVVQKALNAPTSIANNSMLTDSGDGRNKRFNRLLTIHPREILLFFASLSSMGTMILIYFTLAIKRQGEA